MTEARDFTLPGGLIDGAGARHRDGWLRPLTGRDEDWLCSLAPATRQAGLISALLARCVARIGPYDVTTELSRELPSIDLDDAAAQRIAQRARFRVPVVTPAVAVDVDAGMRDQLRQAVDVVEQRNDVAQMTRARDADRAVVR